MTDEQLKLIYDYMSQAGWRVDDDLSTEEYEYISNQLDSNSAWEVVQEMGRKGELDEFGKHFVNNKEYHDCSDWWLFNPENFFNCFAKWLELKEAAK